MEGSLVGSTVTEKADADLVASPELGRKSGSGCCRQAAADNTVGPQNTEIEIGNMHRTTFAFAVPGLTPIQLGHHAVQIRTFGDAVPMSAVRADDLDEAAAKRAREEAERELKDRAGNMEFAEAQARLAKAMAQLRALEQLRKRAGISR